MPYMDPMDMLVRTDNTLSISAHQCNIFRMCGIHVMLRSETFTIGYTLVTTCEKTKISLELDAEIVVGSCKSGTVYKLVVSSK